MRGKAWITQEPDYGKVCPLILLASCMSFTTASKRISVCIAGPRQFFKGIWVPSQYKTDNTLCRGTAVAQGKKNLKQACRRILISAKLLDMNILTYGYSLCMDSCQVAILKEFHQEHLCTLVIPTSSSLSLLLWVQGAHTHRRPCAWRPP